MPAISGSFYPLVVFLLATLALALPAAAAGLGSQRSGKGHLELRYVYYYHDDYSRYRIIGGVCAGVAVIIGITTTLLWWRRRERKRNGVMRPAIRLNDMSAVPQGTVMSGAMVSPHAVLTFSQFNYMPRSVSKGDSGSCNLCSRHMAKNDEIVSLHPCNHKFHVECAFDWFTQKSVNCPECGQDMIKSLGLPEPMYYGRQNADTTGVPAYQMPDPNQYGTNNSNGNYPMAPNQAHVTDKQNPFL